jgi:hypothetical protein
LHCDVLRRLPARRQERERPCLRRLPPKKENRNDSRRVTRAVPFHPAGWRIWNEFEWVLIELMASRQHVEQE